MFEKTDVVTDKGFNIEKLVTVSTASKHDPTKTKDQAEKCKNIYKSEFDCATSYALLNCLQTA